MMSWLFRRYPDTPIPRYCLIALFALLPSNAAHASGEADAFALPGVGARQGGMGGAFVGLSDDIEAIYYNPAGLGNLIQSGVTGMYQPASLGTTRSFLGFSQRWAHPRLPGSVGFGWLRMGSADIELTDTDENVLGTDQLSNDLFLLSAGVRPFLHWSFGLSLKYFRFAFNDFKESGFGVDLGTHAQYRPFRFGVVLSDLGGTKLSGDSISPSGGTVGDVVPPRLKTGVGAVFPQPFNWPLTMVMDLDTHLKLRGSQDTKTSLGMEVWTYNDHIAARTGYQESGGPTLGFGARWGQFQIDYSFLFSLNLKDEHRMGLTYRY